MHGLSTLESFDTNVAPRVPTAMIRFGSRSKRARRDTYFSNPGVVKEIIIVSFIVACVYVRVSVCASAYRQDDSIFSNGDQEEQPTRLITPLADKPIFSEICMEDKRGIKMDEELSRWT
ncbi:uncharacterized protein LOC113004106 [Solenopsis invicta]|uniref:uncharacterized protein LOC113004106 n=1 Tax=Solenopsis invicta TaxID=13686 RepID=UPI000E33EC8E|nr:uncharacterized protein LOC113004106 [Solenopsis invicta]